jgi:hypothetical protein
VWPHQIAISTDDAVRGPAFLHFVRVERGVNAAEDHERPTRPCEVSDRIAAKRVGGVNANADHVSRVDAGRIERLERLVHDQRRAEACRRGRRQHIQPSRRDDGSSEREIAWIDEMDAHSIPQKAPAIFLPNRLKNPAVAVPAL